MRRAIPALSLLAGVAIGATATSALRNDGSSPVLPVAAPAGITATALPASPIGLLLAWVPGGLPAGFVDRVRSMDELTAVTVVLGDTLQLASSSDADGEPVDAPADDRTVPLESIAVDCASWARVVPLPEATSVCALGASEALLGATSARLRRVGAGATLTLANGFALRVAGVVDDEVVGAAELVVRAADAAAVGIHTERYVLATYPGDRAAAEARVRAATDVPLRVRGPGETPWLRQGDAVLPESQIKSIFGEFAARVRGDGTLDVDPAWTAANLETIDLPVLGSIRCHRLVVPALRAALGELAGRGLLGALDRGASGCWNPRVISGTDQPSRHAWGVAIDLVPLPPGDEVVEIMERWGFTWGGRWVEPDPVHFEFVRPAPG